MEQFSATFKMPPDADIQFFFMHMFMFKSSVLLDFAYNLTFVHKSNLSS